MSDFLGRAVHITIEDAAFILDHYFWWIVAALSIRSLRQKGLLPYQATIDANWRRWTIGLDQLAKWAFMHGLARLQALFIRPPKPTAITRRS